ncbi:MAG: RDD family protein [Bacteroidetes bacterium]|nr:RDD family protein [Bacteroidota bacterium]
MEEQFQQPQVVQAPGVTYAGFWWRFLAYIIDDFILSFVNFVLIAPVWAILGLSFFGMMGHENYSCDESWLGFIGPFVGVVIYAVVVSTCVQWLYFALMESSKHQATLGKMAIGAKVTDMQGGRISFARATGRYFAKILSGMILMIGYIMAGFTEKKQALHDILAETLVIKL